MNSIIDLTIFITTAIIGLVIGSEKFIMTCYYDTFSINRLGVANFTINDLENGLPLCDRIIFGYVGLNAQTFDLTLLHPLQINQLTLVKSLKAKHKKTKFILSLGGDKDLENREKYLRLLEANIEEQLYFIASVKNVLLKYKFDGFDLAYQLPKKSICKAKAQKRNKTKYYRQKMTQLIMELKKSFQKENLMLSLTVLPNTQTEEYLDVTSIIHNLDFVTLAAFDFSLPQQTPKKAYYMAPLYATTYDTKHYRNSNVLYVLNQWNSKVVPSKKINLGIAVFGRTWNTTETLKDPHMPITNLLNGPAAGGPNTRIPGLLAWPEICRKLKKISKINNRVYGNYAYRPGIPKRDEGLLITYESPKSIQEKIKFTKSKGLQGVAIFDLTLDDFRGKCRGEKYMMLKTIKRNLN
ncbi:chitinase-like protein Idgf3 [Haematobia irritans]|uniref:chitinase-like protein Idgf3 n=1 Tax=Haematobia irritans TaxID=7368 RepID=UPI003F4FDD93